MTEYIEVSSTDELPNVPCWVYVGDRAVGEELYKKRYGVAPVMCWVHGKSLWYLVV